MNPSRDLTIEVLEGGNSDEVRIVSISDVCVIGKDPACDLVLSARGVSRRHCQLKFVDREWVIVDMNSTNGVFLNGRQVRDSQPEAAGFSTILPMNAELTLGDARLRVMIQPLEEKTEIITPQAMAGRGLECTEVLPSSMNRIAMDTPSPMSHSRTIAPPGQAATSVTVNQTGTVFRDYRIIKPIGQGGMGEVFLACTNSNQDQFWAIKFLKPKGSLTQLDRDRFVREMEITRKLTHPALIRCVDCGDHDGQLFIVTDYCAGGNLQELLKRSGPLTIKRAFRLVDRLLSGIAHAHQLGIVHRDLKPSNILLHRESERKYSPKTADFGLAKSFLEAGESGMTVNGTVGGSWPYMPREQLTNYRYVSPSTDVWSMGAILYECLTLQLPRIMQPGMDPIRTILTTDVVPIRKVLPDLHPALAAFVMKALANTAIDRYKDAGKMQLALRAARDKAGLDA